MGEYSLSLNSECKCHQRINALNEAKRICNQYLEFCDNQDQKRLAEIILDAIKRELD